MRTSLHHVPRVWRQIVETAEEYVVIMEGFPETAAVFLMKVYERECDEKVQYIMKELCFLCQPLE